MSAKLNTLELAELNAVIARTATVPADAPLHMVHITLKGFRYPIVTPMTVSRAEGIQARGHWQIGDTIYTVESVEVGEQL